MKLKNYAILGERVNLQDISEISKESNQIYEENCITAKLFDKPIYFSTEKLQNYSIDFWHMASLENKDLKRRNNAENYYNVKPCNNTNYSNKCTNCVEHLYPINIRNTSRDKCIYRMATIEWFGEIISKANKSDSNVKIWKVNCLNSKRVIETQVKIRYQESEIDYLIILKETENTHYFITAYPVFEHRQKIELDKEYRAKSSIIIK